MFQRGVGLRHTGRAGVAALLIAVLLATVLTVRARGSEAGLCQRHATDAATRSRIVTGAEPTAPTISVIGDSWSVGLGLDDLGKSWPSELPGRVRVAGFSGSGFSPGASHCGNRSFATRAASARGADLVVVQGGLNDYDQPVADIRAGFRALLTSLPGSRVVVVGPVAAPSRADAVGRVDATLAELCAEYGVAYIDASAWSLSYLPDRLHLTQSGHESFGQRVADELVARGLQG
ncbi:MAG TPA: SGNH/GDSL hydrolase family protein [Nocardioides sp.]|nr:SGNH/GDSL hydrolase family protein [Nocardioides sp.]